MAMTIKHLDGPLAGEVQEFGDSVDAIMFGRSPECEVRYPPDFTLIAKHHLRLRRLRVGEYTLDLAAQCSVEIDGMRATGGRITTSKSLIRLGGRDGPSFTLEIRSGAEQALEPMMEEAASSIPRTISDDESGDARRRIAAQIQPEDVSIDGAQDEADEEIINDIARVLSGSRSSEPEVEFVEEPAPEEPIVQASASKSTPEPKAPEPQPAAAAPKPMSTSEEAVSSLERAIAALRAGRVQTSSSSFSFQRQPNPAFRSPEPEHRRAYRAPNPSRSLERESSLSAFGVSNRAQSITGTSDRNDQHRSNISGSAAKAIKGLVRPLLRRWLDENLSKVLRDIVDVSVFGPHTVRAERECLVQVFLHQPEHSQTALSLAKESDPDATRRGVPQTLIGEVERGQKMEIVLDGRGLEVERGRQFLIWSGEPCGCQFRVRAPSNAAGRVFCPRVLVLANSLPLGSVNFTLSVAEAEGDDGLVATLGRFRRYTYAFLSYASPDRAEVLRRAQMLRLMGINFFNDLLSIEPGEEWMQRLYAEIDRCDVFCLFWSSQARLSEWVMKEIDHALARGAANDGVPDIVPVIIEGPPPPAPPESLKHLQFNDWMLYVLASEQRGASAEH